MRMDDISHMVNAQLTLCLNAHPGDMLIQGMAALLDIGFVVCRADCPTGASDDGIRGLPVSTSEQEHCRPDIALVSRGQIIFPYPVYNNHYDSKNEINSLVMCEPTGRFVITARGRSAKMPNSSTSAFG